MQIYGARQVRQVCKSANRTRGKGTNTLSFLHISKLNAKHKLQDFVFLSKALRTKTIMKLESDLEYIQHFSPCQMYDYLPTGQRQWVCAQCYDLLALREQGCSHEAQVLVSKQKWLQINPSGMWQRYPCPTPMLTSPMENTCLRQRGIPN